MHLNPAGEIGVHLLADEAERDLLLDMTHVTGYLSGACEAHHAN